MTSETSGFKPDMKVERISVTTRIQRSKLTRCVFAIATVLLSSCNFGRGPQLNEDYAAWSSVNQNGTWTMSTETAIRQTSLVDQRPADVARFCPRYAELNENSRVMFWVGLLSAIAKYESSFESKTEFIENIRDSKGNKVVSRGLLQISLESANQKRYSCDIAAEADLHDPAVNLACGARILSTWVEKDGAVAYTKGRNLGGARYWSTLRKSRQALPKISQFTRELEFCRI